MPTFNDPYYSPSNDLTSQKTQSRSRVGGSSFTVFTWQDQIISFARQIQVQSPAPVGPGTTPIHPLDSPYPVELITPMALTMGTIVLEMYELYGSNVWQRLKFLDGSSDDGTNAPVDLANIFAAVVNTPKPIHLFRVIKPPSIRGKRLNPYTEEFHNCVVSTLDDGETIEVGTMEVLKRITVNYTHITRGGKNALLSSQTQLGSGPPKVPITTQYPS